GVLAAFVGELALVPGPRSRALVAAPRCLAVPGAAAATDALAGSPRSRSWLQGVEADVLLLSHRSRPPPNVRRHGSSRGAAGCQGAVPHGRSGRASASAASRAGKARRRSRSAPA